MHKYHRLLRHFMRSVLSENLGKRILVLLFINVASTIALLYHCVYTNSMALTAFTYLSIFNALRLTSLFVSIWIPKQKQNFSYSFGYERFEVLAVFSCTAITQLSGFFIFKESFERLIQQDKVLADSQITMVLFGSFVNVLVNYGVENKPFSSVSRGASSNWIQDALFDLGKSICGTLPLLSKFLLVRLDPYMLLSHTAGLTVIISSLLIEHRLAYEADTISAMLIAIAICVTMYPLSYHCAMILMNATPKEVITSIDKCLKEANTLDGLLEFRKENFWSISFGKYLILAQLTNKLSPYLHYISIQIFKDDWTRAVTSSTDNHVYDPRANLPYVSQLAGIRTSLPYSQPMTYNINGALRNPLERYQTNGYQNATSGYKSYKNKSMTKEPAVRSKYSGPKIDINFD